MPVTDRLMGVGEWRLRLKESAKTETRELLSQYGSNVIVLPTDAIDYDTTLANLTARAVWNGLVTRKGDQLSSFGGPGMWGYSQTAKGEAGLQNAIAGPFPATFTTIVTQMFSGDVYSNGLNDGTAYSPTATTATFATFTNRPPLKAALDTVAKETGNEYRMLPNGTVDYGIATALFRSTPNVVVSPDLKGRTGDYLALDVMEWSYSENIDNYRNAAYVLSNDETVGKFSSTASTDGNAVAFLRWGSTVGNSFYTTPTRVVMPTNSTASLNRLVAAAATEYQTPSYTIRCKVRDFCLPRVLTPGDWVYALSIRDGLKDPANQIHVSGQDVAPKKMRCTGLTYPLEEGMGIYHYYDNVISRITDQVAWESAGAAVELDSRPASLLDVLPRSALA